LQDKAALRRLPYRGNVTDMLRMVTQIMVGLMLLFGVATLFTKSYFEFRTGRKKEGMLYLVLGGLAMVFSFMAFYYAYLLVVLKITP
jgi:uncharacterized membrane protein